MILRNNLAALREEKKKWEQGDKQFCWIKNFPRAARVPQGFYRSLITSTLFYAKHGYKVPVTSARGKFTLKIIVPPIWITKFARYREILELSKHCDGEKICIHHAWSLKKNTRIQKHRQTEKLDSRIKRENNRKAGVIKTTRALDVGKDSSRILDQRFNFDAVYTNLISKKMNGIIFSLKKLTNSG